MSVTLLNFSQHSDLESHAQAIAEVQAVAGELGIRPLVVGAFARDLHLVHAHAIPVVRQTADIDLALAVNDWQVFEQLHARLIASGRFSRTNVAHRLRHRARPVDLVPFGAIETADRKIVWPPRGEIEMDAFGFEEAQRAAIDALLPGDVHTQVVTLPALALLKLVCWQERYLTFPKKDAADVQLITTNYLRAGNQNRLWDEFLHWTTHDDAFDYDEAGARMLGHDIATLVDPIGRGRVARLLASQSDEDQLAPLPREMNELNPEHARRLLVAMLRGLIEISQ